MTSQVSGRREARASGVRLWVLAGLLAGCFGGSSDGDGAEGGTSGGLGGVVAGVGAAGSGDPSGPGLEPPIAGDGSAGQQPVAGAGGAAGGAAGGQPAGGGGAQAGAAGEPSSPTADLPDGGVCRVGALDCRCETSGRCDDGLMCYSSRCVPLGSVGEPDAGSSVDFDCFEFPVCDVATPCEGGLHCIALPSCMRAGCIETSMACQIECGSPECGLLESYPEQLACN